MASFDVIYSLPDEAEREAIAEMARVLKPGGHLVLNVAAMEILRDNHSVLSGEVRRYSRASLRRALEAGGFKILRLTYTNAAFFPLVLATRTAQRFLGLSQKPGCPSPGRETERWRVSRCRDASRLK